MNNYIIGSAQHGYVRKANGDIFPIDWTDFHMAKVPDKHDNLPKALNISFEANGEVFSSSVYTTDSRVSLAGTVPRGYETELIKAQIGKYLKCFRHYHLVIMNGKTEIYICINIDYILDFTHLDLYDTDHHHYHSYLHNHNANPY